MIWKPAAWMWSWNLTVAHWTSQCVSLFAFHWSSLWECGESGWTGGPVPAGIWTGGLSSSTTQAPCSGDFWWTCGSPSPNQNPSIPAASANTVVHEYGWQARIPGIINVPRGHINHITIKRPNAPKTCNSTRKKSRRQTVLERREAAVLSVGVLLGDASAHYIAPQLRSGVDGPKHLMWQGWMQLHARMVYLGRDVDRHLCIAAVDIENTAFSS